ncbi:DUF6518 family protein [Actinopolymorpha pittospori]
MSTTERPAATRGASAASSPTWLLLAVSVAVGLAGGVPTSFGQTVLPGGWSALANSASTWVMIAFLVGLAAAGRWRTAAVAGLLTQAGLVVGYYAATEARGYAASMTAVIIWVGTGVVAGPAYGLAGALLRTPRRPIRVAAVGITGSVWLCEGLRYLWLATDANSHSGPGTTAGWCYIAVGLLLPVVLARSMRDRCWALLALAAGVCVAAAAFAVVQAMFLHV